MNLGSNLSIPLWLLYEDEIESWRSTKAPLARQWLGEQNFKAEKHRVVLLPDANGGLAAAVAGLGKRQGELSLWHAAGLAERLPARRFRFAQEFNAVEATQLALGFAYGA
jgi:leucyl aminopeptidase